MIKKTKQGRPSKYTPKIVKVICDAVADGVPFKHAAAIGGISQDTFHQWKRTIPAFSESIEAAAARGMHSRLKLIKKAAEKGDVRASCWYLEHVHPEYFSKSREVVFQAVANRNAILNSEGELNVEAAREEISPAALKHILGDILSGRATRFQGKFAPPIIDLPPPASEEIVPNDKPQSKFLYA